MNPNKSINFEEISLCFILLTNFMFPRPFNGIKAKQQLRIKNAIVMLD